MISNHKDWLAAVGEIKLLAECDDLSEGEEIYLDDLIYEATEYQKRNFPGGEIKNE
jgi:hypothetical protein